jgi:hypothetical protein
VKSSTLNRLFGVGYIVSSYDESKGNASKIGNIGACTNGGSIVVDEYGSLNATLHSYHAEENKQLF